MWIQQPFSTAVWAGPHAYYAKGEVRVCMCVCVRVCEWQEYHLSTMTCGVCGVCRTRLECT
jgi:hypothetical protein